VDRRGAAGVEVGVPGVIATIMFGRPTGRERPAGVATPRRAVKLANAADVSLRGPGSPSGRCRRVEISRPRLEQDELLN